MRTRTIATLTLFALVVFVVQATAQSGAVLVNPDFEDGFSMRESQEVEVANGWGYDFLSGDDRECRAPCVRPEWKPEQQPQYVTQGDYSQRWFSTYARHFAAIYQTVDVEPGQWYEFSCDVYAISDPPGELGIFVGINPWNNSVWDRTMVWGKEQVGDQGWIYREWVRSSVTAQAYSGKMRVAVGSNPQWAVRENTLYVDNCSIRKVTIGAQPTPAPTQAPQPCPTSPPGGSTCDYVQIRSIVREELDKTRLTH